MLASEPRALGAGLVWTTMNTNILQADPLPRARAGTFRELLVVAIPLIISSGSTAMMYVVDRVFLTWDSVDAMAAALPAGVLHWNLAVLALGTVTYANAFIGQYEGANQHHRVGPVLWQGVYLALIAALLMLICIPLAPAIFAWFGHDGVIQGLELRFFKILCWGTLPLLLDGVLSCFYSGRGQTLVVMVINSLGMAINIGLDYLLIFGHGGFPAMGIDGAALATVLAFSSITVMYVGTMLWSQRHGPYQLWAGRHFDRELFSRLLRFGLPSGIQQFLDIACWNVFVQIIGRLGTEQLSATSLVFNLNALVFIPLLGLGTAVMVLTGHRIGEGRPALAVRTTWLAFGLASAYCAAFCFVFVFVPEVILGPYDLSQREGVRELVIVLLRFVAVYCMFDAMAVVFNSAIRGAGDTRFALVFSFSMGLIFLVLPTYLASTFYGAEGFKIAWYAVTVFITLLGLGFMARFLQGRWMTMRVIEHTAPELESARTGAPAEPIVSSLVG
jgi:multidrug resistance protein, MATE family